MRIVKFIKKWQEATKPEHQVGIFEFKANVSIKLHRIENRGPFVWLTQQVGRMKTTEH